MTHTRIGLFALIFAAFSLVQVHAEDPVISAAIDRASYEVGDTILVRVEIAGNIGIDGLFFDLSFPGEHLSFQGAATTDGRVRYAHSDYEGSNAARDHVVVSFVDEGAARNGALLTRDGRLVELRFRVVQPGVAGERFAFRFHEYGLVDPTDGGTVAARWDDSPAFELGALSSDGAYIVIANPANNTAVHSEEVAVDVVFTADARYTVRLSNRTSRFADTPRAATFGAIEGAAISLVDGSNVLEAKLFDEHGGLVASDTSVVVRAAEDTFVRIISPVDRALVNTDMIEVRAVSSLAEVTINGQPTDEIAIDESGEREVSSRVWLSEGFNTITARVQHDGATYTDEIEVYYHRDESIFAFTQPLAGEVFRIGESAVIPVAGEIGALLSESGEPNTVTIRARYYPTNPNKPVELLIDDRAATVSPSTQGVGNAAYRFTLAEPIDIGHLESGEIQFTAYMNKVGSTWDQETHRIVTVDDNRFFIDLTQPRVFGTDALDTQDRIQQFHDATAASGEAIFDGGIMIDDTATFRLGETDLVAAAESAFGELAVVEFVESRGGDVYALVNETGTMRIVRLAFGSREWETLVTRDDLYGYTLSMSDYGVLVGVSNVFSSSNSGLYLLRDDELVNITIGEPLPYVQFIENHDGYISLYGNDFSHLYSFNLFSLEDDGTRLHATAVDAVPFDNRFFIDDFVLSRDRRTAIIHKTDGTVRFYQNDRGTGFTPATFDGGDIPSHRTFSRIVVGEYTTGDYVTYLLLGENPGDASEATTVMEQRSNGRLLVNKLDLTFFSPATTTSERLIGATFSDDRFALVGHDPAAGEYGAYRMRSGEILFNTFYQNGDASTYTPRSDLSALSGDSFAMLVSQAGFVAVGYGGSNDGVLTLRTQYPERGRYRFGYANPDIEGIDGFRFELPPAWVDTDALRLHFAVLSSVGTTAFESATEATSIADFLTLDEQAAFTVSHHFDAGIGRYVVSVDFASLAEDHELLFDIVAEPVGSASPVLANLHVNKKIPVRLPRSPEPFIDLPIRGFVYDPTVTEVFIEEYRTPIRRDGSFEITIPIASDEDATRIDLYAYNRLGESTSLSFAVELFDSINALESVRIADGPTADGDDIVFSGREATVDRNTVYVSAELFGLVGVVAGYELFELQYDGGDERRVRIDGGLFELRDPAPDSDILERHGIGTGYEAAAIIDEAVQLYPGTQEMVVYVENPGGHRSEYLIGGEYPSITYTVPEDEQRIIITSISAVDLEGSDVAYPVPGDESIDVEWRLPMTIDQGPSYAFNGVYTVRGRVESVYAVNELLVRSYDSEVTFDGAAETVVSVDAQGRFSFAATVAMPERSVADAYRFALIPTAPFLSWIASGVEIAAEKTFAGAYVVPDFSPMHSEHWLESHIAALRKPLRIDFDTYVPPGSRITLLVNYETVISGELQEINVGEPTYRVIDSGEPVELSGVKLGLNRIAWDIDYDGYLVSSSSLGADGMVDAVFELTGDYVYADTAVEFPVSFQHFYDPPEAGGDNTLPALRVTKDATTAVTVSVNGRPLFTSGVDEGHTTVTESFVGRDLAEGRNTVVVEFRENTGLVGTRSFEFLIDGRSPTIEIGEWTYTEDYDRLRSFSVIVEEANIDDAVLTLDAQIVGDAVSGSQLGQSATYRYLGGDRYEVRWGAIDEYVYPVRPSPAAPIVVTIRDKANKQALSEPFTGLDPALEPPPEAIGIAIPTGGDHFSYSVTLENERGAVPFAVDRRVKFYADNAHYSALSVDGPRADRPVDAPADYNDDYSYQIERPESVLLRDDADGGFGARISGGGLSVRAGGVVGFGPGFSVESGATLSVEAGLAAHTPRSSSAAYTRPDETQALSVGFYFRFEHAPEFSVVPGRLYRIMTLYDVGNGDGVYLAYGIADGAVRNRAELVLVEQSGGSLRYTTTVPDFLFDYEGPSDLGDWDFILVSADVESGTIRVAVNDELMLSTLPGDIQAGSVLAMATAGVEYYFGERAGRTAFNGEFSIANPFTVDAAITVEDVAELAFAEDAPSYTDHYDGFSRRYFTFDDPADSVGSDYYRLRVHIDGDTYDDGGAVTALAAAARQTHHDVNENADYDEIGGGSLLATAQQVNYIVDDGGQLTLQGAPNTVAYNVSADGTGDSFTLTPTHDGVTGRYFFSNSLGNHGLRNRRWYSVFGTVTDAYPVEIGDARVILRINDREVRQELTNGSFHLVFSNAAMEAPDSVVLYIETDVPIAFEKRHVMFTEGDYALPPEAFESFVPVSVSTEYAFEKTGTLEFWYKPFAVGRERFARYATTLFDSEYVTIETIASERPGDDTMVYRARLHGDYEVAMTTNVPVRAGWRHLQLSYDTNNGVAFFYIDGEVASSISGGLPVSRSMDGNRPLADNVWIGADRTRTTFADGYIDQLRLSSLYKAPEFVPNTPVVFTYREDTTAPGAPVDYLTVGDNGAATDIAYRIARRNGEAHLSTALDTLIDPSTAFGDGWDALTSGAYTFDAAMEVNGYRFDDRVEFVRDIRPQFVIKHTTPLVIQNQSSRIDVELGFDASYLTESEVGRYAGIAIRVEGASEHGVDFDRTIYAIQDWTVSDPSRWVWIEPAVSMTAHGLVSNGSELVVAFDDIITDRDVRWEARSFYLTGVFDASTYRFDTLLHEFAGDVPIASFSHEIVRTAGGEEFKVRIVVGNGEQLDPTIADSLGISYHVSDMDEVAVKSGSVEPIPGSIFDIYYEDMLPTFGVYDVILSLAYDGQSYNSQQLTATWEDTVQTVEEIIVDRRLNVTDFSVLSLTKDDASAVAKLYLEYEASGVGDLRYDLHVFVVEDDGDYRELTDLTVKEQVLYPGGRHLIIDGIVVPEGRAEAQIVVYDLVDEATGLRELERDAELEIVNSTLAPEVVFTNTVESYITYNNVMFSWRGYHDGEYKPEIGYSYNVDGSGWTVATPDAQSIELYGLAEGFHTFQVRAYYQGEASATRSVTYFIDLNRPTFDPDRLSLVEVRDEDGFLKSVRISGEEGAVVDAALETLYIAGQRVPVTDGGRFNAVEIAITTDGDNEILLTAYDTVGNYTDYVVVVDNALTTVFGPPLRDGERHVRFAPAVVVGRLDATINAAVEIYLADPTVSFHDRFDGWKRATINEDRTFFVEDVYLHPGSADRSAATDLTVALVTESGRVYTRTVTTSANTLTLPIELDFSARAVQGEAADTTIEIAATAKVDGISSWSIDYDGDGVYDEVTMVDDPGAGQSMAWVHSYSSLGKVHPRVRVITRDGLYFSAVDQLIMHEQIRAASNIGIEDPIAMDAVRMPDGSQRIFALAGMDADYRIETYEVGRNETYVSAKLFQVALSGMGIENPAAIRAVDAEHLYIADNGTASAELMLLARNEFGNFVPTGTPVAMYDAVQSIAVGEGELLVTFRNSAQIARVVLDGGGMTGEVTYGVPRVPTGAAIGSAAGIAVDAFGTLVADRYNQRVVRLSTALTAREFFGSFGFEEGEFLSPTQVGSYGERIFVYDATRRDVQVLNLDFNPVTRLEAGPEAGDYLSSGFLDDLGGMNIIAREENGRLYYYALLLSRATEQLSMVRLPQWEELRARVRNNTLVFARDREIYSAKPSGADLRRLVSSDSIPRTEGDLDYPALSPDGHTLVFTSRANLYDATGEVVAGNAHAFDNLYIMDVGGGNLRRIPLNGIEGYEIERPVFDSNGDRIAFSAKPTGGRWQIYVYSIDTGGVERLIDTDENVRFPYFSPDDRFVVFTTDYGGDEDIDIVDVQNPNVRVSVTDNHVRDSFPVWNRLYPHEIANPDTEIDSKIAFVSERDGLKRVHYIYLARPSDGDIRVVTREGEETGGDPDGAAIPLDTYTVESDYPSFSGDGTFLVYEYHEGWDQDLYRFDHRSGTSASMEIPGGATRPAGMKNTIANFAAIPTDGDDLRLSWRPYTDTDLFYTVEFAPNRPDEATTQKKVFTDGDARLADLEMGAEYLVRVFIEENGEESATSQWIAVTIPEVQAIPTVVVDEENPYLVRMNAWVPDEDEVEWNFTWIVDNQEFESATSTSFAYEFATSGPKTVQLKATNLANTYVHLSQPVTVEIESDIVPVIEYVLAADSSYVELSAESSLGSKIDWSSVSWIVSGPGQTPLAPVSGSRVIVPLDIFEHKVNVNLSLSRLAVNGQSTTDRLETNMAIDLDFKDVMPVITYTVDEENPHFLVFSGAHSVGNIDWYNARWEVFGDGQLIGQQAGGSSFAHSFPEDGNDRVYTAALTIPRISDGRSETASMVVSIEATPVEPIIDFEIMTIEVDNEVVGTKLMLDASSSKGNRLDFANAVWSVPVAGGYGEQPTQVGPTAIYNLMNIEHSAQIEVALTLSRLGGTDPVTTRRFIGLSAGEVPQTRVVVNAAREETTDGTAITFDVLDSRGPNIDWEKTQWLFDDGYPRTGPVARVDVAAAGVLQRIPYTVTVYLYNGDVLTERGEFPIAASELSPHITVTTVPGTEENVFELSVTETQGLNIDWERTKWFIFDGNEDVVEARGATVMHAFAHAAQQTGYPVMVEMYYRGEPTAFVGYTTVDVEGDELLPVIEWDVPTDAPNGAVVTFTAQSSKGSNIDWGQTRWTFGDSSESQYGSVVAHQYPVDGIDREYTVTVTLVRRISNGRTETATTNKTIRIDSAEIKPVMRAELHDDGYLVVSAEESEGRGLMLDRTAWLFEGEGDSGSYTESRQDGVIRNESSTIGSSESDSRTEINNHNAGNATQFGSAASPVSSTFSYNYSWGHNDTDSSTESESTSVSTTSYEDYVNTTKSFSTSNSHIGAVARRYVDPEEGYVQVTMFVYRANPDGTMVGESITVNVSLARAAERGGVRYE